MSRPCRAVSMIAAAPLLLGACARTYHPEYHPETSYSYVANATYVQNAIFAGGPSPPGRARPSAKESDPTGTVTSPGGVVIYGDFNGSIYLGR
jgi:hypothetical protein